ncbi:uncharacterized protein LOC141912009 [Tubulanus polymorphus]|uniref:uncharacterized protein LOC141912009 n=1 Tax=Tubulanus polymorphus TaxID=672921 RepID=UPI003DA1FB45
MSKINSIVVVAVIVLLGLCKDTRALQCYKCPNFSSCKSPSIVSCPVNVDACVAFYYKQGSTEIEVRDCYIKAACPGYIATFNTFPAFKGNCCATDKCNSGFALKASGIVAVLVAVLSTVYNRF